MSCRSALAGLLAISWLVPQAPAQPPSSQALPPEAGHAFTALRQRFAMTQRSAPLAHKSAILAAGLQETAAALGRVHAKVRAGETEGLAPTLGAESDRLALLDREYEATFADIGSKLRQAGLDSQIPRLDEFAGHYRTQMASLRNAIRSMAAGGRITEEQVAQARRMLDGSPGQRPQPENGIRPAHTRPFSAMRAKSKAAASPPPPADAADLPTPADLAENSIVRLTPEIRAKAAELGNSPALIYQHVRTNFEFEPYDWVMQGSDSVYWSGRGNETDLASYLIALLRAAGTPARYALATVQVPYSQIMPWFGVKSRSAAGVMLGLFNGDEWKTIGDAAAFLHYYVEAYTDTANGKAWVPLDASFKTRQFPGPGIAASRPLFDRPQYLSSGNPELGTEAYLDQFRAALAKTNAGASLSDAAYEGALLPDNSGGLPASLPYQVVDTPLHLSDLGPRNIQHAITIEVTDPGNNNASLVKARFNVSDVLLHSLTIGFVNAPGASPAAIEAFGGAANTPLFLLGPAAGSSLTPEIRLDGRPVATGTKAATLTWLNVHVGYFFGQETDDYLDANHVLYPAQTLALVLNGYQATDRYLGSRIDGLLSRPDLGGSDPQGSLNDLLPLAGLRYFNRLMLERTRLATPLQLRYIETIADETAVLSYAGMQYLFDRPFLLAPERMVLDARGLNQWFCNLNTGDLGGADLVGVREAFGLTESSLEHELWEELLLTPSVSTTKLLQSARANNASILTITSGNVGTVLPKLGFPDYVVSLIQADAAQGRTITITDRAITVGKFQGLGWISEYPDGTGAYALAGFNGGDSGGNPNNPRPPTSEPGATGNSAANNGTACSDPVTVSNGNLFQTARDLWISSRGPAFSLQRTYNSLLSANDGPFGFGWTHSYNLALKDNQNSIVFYDETGGTFEFAPQGPAYLSAVLPYLSLTKDAQGYTLRHKNGPQWRFNTKGQLISIADRMNSTMLIGYDSNGRLAGATDALNRSISILYNGQGHIVAVQDFTGRRVAYEYDAGGNLTAVTDAAGNRTVYGYYTDANFNHLLKTMTTPAGGTTSYEYYVNRKAARTVDPGSRTVRFLYLPLSDETVVIDGRGFATTYVYNALGNVTRIIKPDGNFADRLYTAAAQVAAVMDEAGDTTRYDYDAVGNVLAITDPSGNRTSLTYEPKFNRLSSIRDRRGALTTFEYDGNGNLMRVAGPLGYESRYTYNGFGQVLTATNSEGNTFSLTYDAAGNLTQFKDPLGQTSQIDYDGLRRPFHFVDPAGNQHSESYDVLDRIVRAVDPLGNAASLTYSPDGLPAQLTDAAARVTRYAYDGINNLNRVTDAQGNTTSYGFNISDCACSAAQNLVSYRAPSGQTLSLDYDSNDRVTQVRDALGGSTSFLYDGRGDLVAKTDPNGETVAFQYDAAGHMVRKSFPDGTDVRFAYDANGNLVGASNQNVAYTFAYDDRNRLVSATDSRFNKTLRYAYDRLGRRTSLTDSEGGVIAYTWDANDRLLAVRNPAGATATFGYDAIGRRTSLLYSNGIATASRYDAAGRLTSLAHTIAPDAGPFAASAYSYDQVGNPVSLTDSFGVHTYRYDQLDRLVAASHPSTPAESYLYDGAGNRLTSAGGSGYAYDAAGRLISAEGFTHQYDKNGNLVQRSGPTGTTAYSYDAESRLAAIGLPDGSTAAYKYDPFGRRIEKRAAGKVTEYVYDLDAILLELDASGVLQARYVHGPGVDQPLMMERGGRTYFYHLDGFSNVWLVTDTSGHTVYSYGYDSFGKLRVFQAPNYPPRQPPVPVRSQFSMSPYGFAGREFDAESGLYYMRARYYDPVTGRFLSPDPLDLTALLMTSLDARAQLALLPVSAAALAGSAGMELLRVPQQLNPYSYARNNPLVYRDPSGLKCSSGTHIVLGLHANDLNGIGGEQTASGYIRNFPDWLRKNGYSIQLRINEWANIMDSSHHVIGIVHTVDLPEGLAGDDSSVRP